MIKQNILPLRRQLFDLAIIRAHSLLIAPVSFSMLLLMARTVYTGKFTFLFLVWNLFLAYVPFFISYMLSTQPALRRNRFKLFTILAIWLFFVPNSFYMLTDLIHLFDGRSVPFWYDLLLVFSFIWSALLMGFLSVRHIEELVFNRWGYKGDWLFTYPVMALNALGVYIGRYPHFNTWELVSNPFMLADYMLHMVRYPVYFKSGWGMVFCFTIFLIILHKTFIRVSRAV